MQIVDSHLAFKITCSTPPPGSINWYYNEKDNQTALVIQPKMKNRGGSWQKLERKELRWPVAELVKNRLEKARSVSKWEIRKRNSSI